MKNLFGKLAFVIFLVGCGDISLTGAETGSGTTSDHSPITWDNVEETCWSGLSINYPVNGADDFRTYFNDHHADIGYTSSVDLRVVHVGKWIVVKNKAGYPVLCGETIHEALRNLKSLADAKTEIYGERVGNTRLPKIKYFEQYKAAEYYKIVRGSPFPIDQNVVNTLKAIHDLKNELPGLLRSHESTYMNYKQLVPLGIDEINQKFRDAWNEARPWDRMLYLQTTGQGHGVYVMGMKADPAKGGSFTTKVPGCTGYKIEPDVLLGLQELRSSIDPYHNVSILIDNELEDRLGYKP